MNTGHGLRAGQLNSRRKVQKNVTCLLIACLTDHVIQPQAQNSILDTTQTSNTSRGSSECPSLDPVLLLQCKWRCDLPSLSFCLIQGSSSLTSVKIPGDPLLEGGRLLLFPQLRPQPLPQEVMPSATQWPLPDPAGHTRGPPESPWEDDDQRERIKMLKSYSHLWKIQANQLSAWWYVVMMEPGRHLFHLPPVQHTTLSWLPEAVPLYSGSEVNLWQSGGHIYTWLGPPKPGRPLSVPQEDDPLENMGELLRSRELSKHLSQEGQMTYSPSSVPIHPLHSWSKEGFSHQVKADILGVHEVLLKSQISVT